MGSLQLGQNIAQSGFTNNFLKHAEAFRLEVLKQQLKDCDAAECTTIAAEITVLEELNTKNLTQRIMNIVFPDPTIHVDTKNLKAIGFNLEGQLVGGGAARKGY